MKTDKKHQLLQSFGFACKGLIAALRTERNFRIHILAATGVVVMGFLVNLNPAEWAVVVVCTGMVLTAELLNTAIEKTIDLVSPQWDKQAGLIKDMAAAAVLIASLAALVVGLVVFVPKLPALFSHVL